MKKQRIEGWHDTWEHIETLMNQYRNTPSRLVYQPVGDQDLIESYIFPITLLELFNEDTFEIYFAFGYHPTATGNITKPGITVILFGINGQNEIQHRDNDAIWDLHSDQNPLKNTPNQNISYVDALTAIEEYRKLDEERFYTTYKLTTSGNDYNYLLKGLRIEWDHIAQFKNRNRPVSKIECIVGYHDDRQNGNSYKGHTFGLIGRNSSERLIQTVTTPNTPPDPDNDVAFDYCDPCPRVCPNFID